MDLFNKNIFLVGLPGSGKSTVGRQLAQRLQTSFIDLDHKIEEDAGLSVRQIFSQFGEEHFRQLEREALLDVINKFKNTVVATGGGTPCFFDNMKVIKERGLSVFIDVPVSELISRINATERDKRPKFSNDVDLSTTLKQLQAQRLPFYNEAHFRWDGVNQTVDDLIVAITKVAIRL